MDTPDTMIFQNSTAINPAIRAGYQIDPVDRAGLPISNRYKGGAAYIDNNDKPFASWGYDNLLGEEYANKIRKSGVLNAALEAKARIAIGKGIKPVLVTGISKEGVEQMEFIYNPVIEDWLENNDHFNNSLTSIKNYIGYGWNHSRIYLSNDLKTITNYKTDDVVNCRLGKKNKRTGQIDYTYYSPNWRNQFKVDDTGQYKKIPLLEPGNEYNDLVQRIADGDTATEYSIINRGDLNGMQYYPYPLWFSCDDWVDLAIKVPAMKKAMMDNQMSIKYLVKISEKYFSKADIKWATYTAAQKHAKFKDKIAEVNNNLVGNLHAYKSIGVQTFLDPGTGTEIADISIEVLDDKIADGKLLPDTGASDKQILFSLMMNPAIMGADSANNYGGGAGSGSDIREAYLVQIMLMEAERRQNSKVFNVIKRHNKWADFYPGQNLQFRYPNLILTTLDTGKSTAPINA